MNFQTYTSSVYKVINIRELGDWKIIPLHSIPLIYEVHFKMILIYRHKTWTLTKRKKYKIKVANMNFFRSTVGNFRGTELEIKFLEELEFKMMIAVIWSCKRKARLTIL